MDKTKIPYWTNMFAGSRVYTFEIGHSPNGARHLIITEATDSPDGEIMLTVSEKYLPIFAEMLNAATRFMVEHKDDEPTVSKASPNNPKTDQKAYSVEGKRKNHGMAYAKWTQADDDTLKRLFAEGKTVEEISRALQRNKGAINSRLNKLGVVR